MNRPKIEDFKPKYTKGVAEIASVAKQYVKAQDEYIDYLEQQVKNCSIPNVVGRSEQLKMLEHIRHIKGLPLDVQKTIDKMYLSHL